MFKSSQNQFRHQIKNFTLRNFRHIQNQYLGQMDFNFTI
ncbi:unnamed protein product [Paramecium sonneborni]|uniref:Uncharacterized protein n=1 Tax=Paramecium sonneborni TaxID=65129 RepID=A0A8S1M7C1_9CILI|nr:unnamed protein product [Paramecium sonneborni]